MINGVLVRSEGICAASPSVLCLPQLMGFNMAKKTTKKKGADGKACWKGYRFAGTKNGKDRCVPMKKKRKK